MKLFVSGSFGEIRTGGGGAGDNFGADADGSVEGESQKVKGKSVAKASDSSISYFTPSISGFKAAVSYSDAGTESKADATEFGLSFTTPLAGSDLTLSFASASTSGNGDDDPDAANGGGSDVSYGAKYSIGALALTVASNTSETEDAAGAKTADYSAVGIGLSYPVSDALTIGIYSVDQDESVANVETSELAASLTYKIASGLTTNLAHTSWEEGSVSGSTTSAYIKVAF